VISTAPSPTGQERRGGRRIEDERVQVVVTIEDESKEGEDGR